MSPDLENIQPILTSGEGLDSYVDPILFAEGVYENQREYEQTIDVLAERINQGVAVPRGREPKAGGNAKSQSNLSNLEATIVQKAIQALQPDLRNIVELYYMQGLTYEEISEELNITKGQVISRVANAIRKISKALIAVL